VWRAQPVAMPLDTCSSPHPRRRARRMPKGLPRTPHGRPPTSPVPLDSAADGHRPVPGTGPRRGTRTGPLPSPHNGWACPASPHLIEGRPADAASGPCRLGGDRRPRPRPPRGHPPRRPPARLRRSFPGTPPASGYAVSTALPEEHKSLSIQWLCGGWRRGLRRSGATWAPPPPRTEVNTTKSTAMGYVSAARPWHGSCVGGGGMWRSALRRRAELEEPL
jgi:hypothetical protein